MSKKTERNENSIVKYDLEIVTDCKHECKANLLKSLT